MFLNWKSKISFSGLLVCFIILQACARNGDIFTPVNTASLQPLGTVWRTANPYLGNRQAISIGEVAYKQNCGRCHENSLSLAPKIDNWKPGPDGDRHFIKQVRQGGGEGILSMPPFEGKLSQEAIWSIRAYLLRSQGESG